MRRRLGDHWPLLVGFCLGSMGWNVCWPFLPLRVQEIGVGDLAEVARVSGFLAGGSNLITALLGPIWSTLGERYGFRRQIVRAHIGTGIAMGAFGLARVPLELFGAGVLLGALGGNYPHYMALAASRAAPADVGRVVGELQAAGQLGATIGPLIGGAVASQVSLGAAFLLSTAIAWSGALFIMLAVKPDQGLGQRGPGGGGSVRAAFARPEQRWLMLLILIGDLGYQGLRPLIPVMIASRVPDPATVAATTGLAATLATGAGVASALMVGRMSRRVAPRTILLFALPTTAVLVALVPFAQEIPALIALLTVGGFASGAVTPTIFAWLGRLAPAGGGFALLASANMFVFAFGPPVMGQVSTYGLEWPFRLAAVLALAAAVLVALRDPPSPRPVVS